MFNLVHVRAVLVTLANLGWVMSNQFHMQQVFDGHFVQYRLLDGEDGLEGTPPRRPTAHPPATWFIPRGMSSLSFN